MAILLLCWIALAPATQYALMTQLIYPASLGVALVLLFDKATRTWGLKPGAESRANGSSATCWCFFWCWPF